MKTSKRGPKEILALRARRANPLLGLAIAGVANARWFNVIRGTQNAEVLVGSNHRDLVLAFAGSDQISAGGARDIVYVIWGGDGSDTITGGNGRNQLHGGNGDDSVTGGPGRDRLWVGAGTDTENGGDGNDVLHALFPDGQVDTLDCGPGDHDIAWIRAGEPDIVTNCEVVKTRAPSSP